ncbi:hypothetical protein [Paenibacillus lentus]|uniref:Anaphase-promoting complex subunit 4 WD40 domain-containing protein n=1 Tax=Paenibacillus lentus TaxID=1338368 RepID=A0A3Q8S693_9BACL|nr:hypothetical protein [Paenibacillus lentus]AZK48177.1 hypothetical protein EIM92_20015 [Paenibacillus lentus]
MLTINSYNWSPDGKQLACAFGDLGSSFLAIFNTGNGELRVVSDEDYESIPAVVWHKDGLGLDFISRWAASEEEVLYRYRQDSIKEVLKLNEKNRQMIMDILPFTVHAGVLKISICRLQMLISLTLMQLM